MGIITAAIVAAAMSSLDSSLNSMATVTTLDFYEKFAKKDGTPEHYLKASRWFTLFWAVLMVVPAIAFTKTGGSVLEVLSKVGSFFVGAKLAMFGLGFFSKHASERGLLIGVAAGFLSLAYVEYYHDVAWPWYCALGGAVSTAVAWVASVLLDGFKTEYSEYTVQGQKALFAREGREEKEDGWYVLAGKVDRASYWLLGYFLSLCDWVGGVAGGDLASTENVALIGSRVSPPPVAQWSLRASTWRVRCHLARLADQQVLLIETSNEAHATGMGVVSNSDSVVVLAPDPDERKMTRQLEERFMDLAELRPDEHVPSGKMMGSLALSFDPFTVFYQLLERARESAHVIDLSQ